MGAPTAVVPHPAVRTAAWIGLPALGAGIGWVLVASAASVISLPFVPMRGLFRLVDLLPDPESVIGATAVGGIAGLLGGWFVAQGGLRVEVADDRVTLVRGDTSRRFDRSLIHAAFRDGDALVLLDPAGRELARDPADLIADRLPGAFRGHGYPWRDDGDPYRADYRRWVPGAPDLPPAADVLLRARQQALEQGHGDDAAEFRAELARLGVVVRDERRRQYWRRTGTC